MTDQAALPETTEGSKKEPDTMEESTKEPEASPFIKSGIDGKRSGTLHLDDRGNERSKCSSSWKLVACVQRPFLLVVAAVLATTAVLTFFITRDRRPQG